VRQEVQRRQKLHVCLPKEVIMATVKLKKRKLNKLRCDKRSLRKRKK